MMTTSMSTLNTDGSACLILGPTVESTDHLVAFLLQYFSNKEAATALTTGNNVLQFSDSPEEIAYGDMPHIYIPKLDIAESQLIVADHNFVYIDGKWYTRLVGENNGYVEL